MKAAILEANFICGQSIRAQTGSCRAHDRHAAMRTSQRLAQDIIRLMKAAPDYAESVMREGVKGLGPEMVGPCATSAAECSMLCAKR